MFNKATLRFLETAKTEEILEIKRRVEQVLCARSSDYETRMAAKEYLSKINSEFKARREIDET
ncbi:hypothetical protein [Acidihalobacter ferrooxydans]|nr:hypothetical protein [Acidihalobacter ferrooxydans]